MTVSSAKKVNAENICIELHWVAVGFALKTLLITTPWIHFQEASVRIASSWTSSSSSTSSTSIKSRGSLQSWIRVILTERTQRIFIGNLIASTPSNPPFSTENYLKLCWCFSSIICILQNPFQLSCSFIFPTLEFFCVLFFHIQVWTGIVFYCLISFSALFPNLWSVMPLNKSAHLPKLSSQLCFSFNS